MSNNWRDYGDTDRATWRETISGKGGPADLASEAAWQAAQPHSRLCLAMLGEESSWGTDFDADPPGNHNPLNLRPPDGSGYVRYATWTAGVAGWKYRLTDQTYKGGIYARTVTLADLIHVYAPASDHNDEAAYISHVAQRIASYPQEDSTVSELVYGNVKHPKYTKHIIWNTAWDDLGPRHNYGVVYHRMLGSLYGTDTYFAGGAAALTHYGTGHPGDHDGDLIMWCDPRSQRAPWASGPVKAPWGDGPAFVAAYGANAVNNDLIAIEISGNYDDPISDTTIETVAQLSAYWADQARVPWDQYPVNPATGLVFTYWHQEFTGPDEKVCPGQVVMDKTQAIIDRTKAILKAAQTQVDTKPTPPPAQPDDPTPTLLPLPRGMTWELVARLFDHAKDPTGKDFRFDQGRAACQVWFNAAVRSIPPRQPWQKGSWPQLTDIIRRGNGAWVYTWSDGSSYISQPMPAPDKHAA